jgi:hypothetical protein
LRWKKNGGPGKKVRKETGSEVLNPQYDGNSYRINIDKESMIILFNFILSNNHQNKFNHSLACT